MLTHYTLNHLTQNLYTSKYLKSKISKHRRQAGGENGPARLRQARHQGGMRRQERPPSPLPLPPGAGLFSQAAVARGQGGVGTQRPPPPVSCLDVAAVGIAGYITNRGWVEIQNPGSPHLSLSLFNIMNMSSCMAAAKRISLNRQRGHAGGRGELEGCHVIPQSLRAARIAQQFT
jgi:hypothetical protein